jgi:hypothetical protein
MLSAIPIEQRVSGKLGLARMTLVQTLPWKILNMDYSLVKVLQSLKLVVEAILIRQKVPSS